MGRAIYGVLVSLMMFSFLFHPLLPDAEQHPTLNLINEPSRTSSSNLSIDFANGPTLDEEVKGTKLISFDITGNGTIESALFELSNDSTSWSTLTNLTQQPWTYPFKSADYTNGTYTLKVTFWDSEVNESVQITSPEFNISNQVPIITSFTVLNPDAGDGSSVTNRAWFNLSSTGTMSFRWGASDDDLKEATLQNVPGPGTPSKDGPGSLNYGWDWSSGAMSEGTWTPKLTVKDYSQQLASQVLYVGIDRTGPTIGSISIEDGATWHQQGILNLTGLISTATDGTGSGVASVEYKLPNATSWSSTSEDSLQVNMEEGSHIIQFRGIDRVGNIGEISNISVNIDSTDPIGVGWTVDELTTSRIGYANVSFSAEDFGSGIDEAASSIQYGFDSNGVGQTPDLSGRWVTLSSSGLDGQVGLNSWVTKSRQYLMFRAIVVDEAGNSMTTEPSAFQILPGLDLGWNSTHTNLDRLIVRPGEQNGNVTISSMIESNSGWGGSVNVRLEAAPADRTASVDWTVLETRTLSAGTLSDGYENLTWQYTVPRSGQFDLRLVIDPSNIVDEYNEGNNNAYLVITGAAVNNPGNVASFAPTMVSLIIAGFVITYLQRQKARD